MQGSQDSFQKSPKKNRRFDDGMTKNGNTKKHKSKPRRSNGQGGHESSY